MAVEDFSVVQLSLSVNSTKLNKRPSFFFFSTLLFIPTLLPLDVIVSTGHLMSMWTNLLFEKRLIYSAVVKCDLTDYKRKIPIILRQTVQRGGFFFFLRRRNV